MGPPRNNHMCAPDSFRPCRQYWVSPQTGWLCRSLQCKESFVRSDTPAVLRGLLSINPTTCTTSKDCKGGGGWRLLTKASMHGAPISVLTGEDVILGFPEARAFVFVVLLLVARLLQVASVAVMVVGVSDTAVTAAALLLALAARHVAKDLQDQARFRSFEYPLPSPTSYACSGHRQLETSGTKST